MYISCTTQRENLKRDVCKGMFEVSDMYTSRDSSERVTSFLNRKVDPSYNNSLREFEEPTSTDKNDMGDIMSTPDGDVNPISEVDHTYPLSSIHMYSGSVLHNLSTNKDGGQTCINIDSPHPSISAEPVASSSRSISVNVDCDGCLSEEHDSHICEKNVSKYY